MWNPFEKKAPPPVEEPEAEQKEDLPQLPQHAEKREGGAFTVQERGRKLHVAWETMPREKSFYNEDRVVLDSTSNVYAILDGIGGNEPGYHAANIASHTLQHDLERFVDTDEAESRALIGEEMGRMNFAVRTERYGEDTRFAGMSTGALIVKLCPGEQQDTWIAAVGHVGHSRLMWARKGEGQERFGMRSLTLDDREYGTSDPQATQDEWDRAEREANLSPDNVSAVRRRKNLGKVIGKSETVDPAINAYEVRKGDRLILLSNTIREILTDREILIALDEFPDLETTGRYLVSRAKALSRKGGFRSVDGAMSAIVIAVE